LWLEFYTIEWILKARKLISRRSGHWQLLGQWFIKDLCSKESSVIYLKISARSRQLLAASKRGVQSNRTRLNMKMMKAKNEILLISAIFFLHCISVFGQKQMAITIDDPTTAETPKLDWHEKDSLILNTLNKYNIKAALFVCGMRVDNANGKALLNNWDSKNHMICNHSYAHWYYNSKSISSTNYIEDFIKSDSLIRTYKNYTRLFRFPYLKEGNTAAKRDSMRVQLKNEGYRNGYVTIDASDWYIDAQLSSELKMNINADLTPYKEYYIKHILERANYYDSLAQLVFKREIKHTLLIHHSLLNALFLDDLLSALKTNGWELIDAKKAYEDEVFLKQPDIVPCGESIVWQCASQIESISKVLRYPAEDGEYEKEPLRLFLNEYKTRTNKD
jgi:peptidoglycan-N-acetylglucosamine deacetylase